MAAWVMYELTPTEARTRAIERKDRFKEDHAVITGSMKPSDLSKTGLDRGHLAPAQDMLFEEVAMTESFLMSNMAAQEPGFNRGIWKKLETWVHKTAAAGDTLWVFSGPILKDNLQSVGNGAFKANHFYKVLVDVGQTPRAIAFVLPNNKLSGSFAPYACSIDSVEALTGLDFLPGCCEALETQAFANMWDLP